MKLQRKNKYKGTVATVLTTTMISSAILSGCSDVSAIAIEGSANPNPTTITTTTEPITTTTPIIEETPEPTVELTPEPVEEYEYMEFEDKIPFNLLYMIIYKTPEDEEKVIFTFIDDCYVQDINKRLTSYYEIQTGVKVYREVELRHPGESEPGDALYILPSLSDGEIVGVYWAVDFMVDYLKTRFSTAEYVNATNVYDVYSPAGKRTDMLKYSIDEYIEFYEQIIPERYKISPSDLIPELEEEKPKSIGG